MCDQEKRLTIPLQQNALKSLRRMRAEWDRHMIDVIFGRSFWSMLGRFVIFALVFNVISLPLLLLTPEDPSAPQLELSLLSASYLAFFNVIFWSWVGWGWAFWRFDRQDIPVKSFVTYPLLSGLFVAPLYWILLSSPAVTELDHRTEAMISATVFGVIVGPLMALITATFWRYAPQTNALQKAKSRKEMHDA